MRQKYQGLVVTKIGNVTLLHNTASAAKKQFGKMIKAWVGVPPWAVRTPKNWPEGDPVWALPIKGEQLDDNTVLENNVKTDYIGKKYRSLYTYIDKQVYTRRSYIQ
jgi:hypothetical protein